MECNINSRLKGYSCVLTQISICFELSTAINCPFLFQVKVMLRVSAPTGNSPPSNPPTDLSNPSPIPSTSSSNSFFSLDKRKKQVTLFDPAICGGASAPEDRRVGVAAPKMFAFDAIFSQDDSQVNNNHKLINLTSLIVDCREDIQFCFKIRSVLR